MTVFTQATAAAGLRKLIVRWFDFTTSDSHTGYSRDARSAVWADNQTGFPARFWSNPNCTGGNVLVGASETANEFPFTTFGLGGH